jgi:malonyl CoA-acyl carrier protein transacylase
MVVYIFPGQGSQKVGMGQDLFEKFPELTLKADKILGYSIAELCLNDPQGKLSQTQFTQPALYVVNLLSYHQKLEEMAGQQPKFVAGHSLGEYSALAAAGCFDFETGLRLVQKRGALMSQVSGGGMAAVIGKNGNEIADILKINHFDKIDVANYNSMKQVVISGLKEDITAAKPIFESAGCKYFPLNVSGAFHSRYMTPAHDEFKQFVDQFKLNSPQIPVIANYTGKPYGSSEVKTNLVKQINHSVKWCESIQYLLEKGEQDFVEIGPGNVLSGLVAKIKRNQ